MILFLSVRYIQIIYQRNVRIHIKIYDNMILETLTKSKYVSLLNSTSENQRHRQRVANICEWKFSQFCWMDEVSNWIHLLRNVNTQISFHNRKFNIYHSVMMGLPQIAKIFLHRLFHEKNNTTIMCRMVWLLGLWSDCYLYLYVIRLPNYNHEWVNHWIMIKTIDWVSSYKH